MSLAAILRLAWPVKAFESVSRDRDRSGSLLLRYLTARSTQGKRAGRRGGDVRCAMYLFVNQVTAGTSITA